MNHIEEIKEIEKQVKEIVEPILKRKRELNDILSKEQEDARKKFFEENILGKIYISETIGYDNEKFYTLYKPIDCKQFGIYNSCIVSLMQIKQSKTEIVLTIKKDTHRVDSFESMTLLTPELLKTFSTCLAEIITTALDNFKV